MVDPWLTHGPTSAGGGRGEWSGSGTDFPDFHVYSLYGPNRYTCLGILNGPRRGAEGISAAADAMLTLTRRA